MAQLTARHIRSRAARSAADSVAGPSGPAFPCAAAPDVVFPVLAATLVSGHRLLRAKVGDSAVSAGRPGDRRPSGAGAGRPATVTTYSSYENAHFIG